MHGTVSRSPQHRLLLPFLIAERWVPSEPCVRPSMEHLSQVMSRVGALQPCREGVRVGVNLPAPAAQRGEPAIFKQQGWDLTRFPRLLLKAHPPGQKRSSFLLSHLPLAFEMPLRVPLSAPAQHWPGPGPWLSYGIEGGGCGFPKALSRCPLSSPASEPAQRPHMLPTRSLSRRLCSAGCPGPSPLGKLWPRIP